MRTAETERTPYGCRSFKANSEEEKQVNASTTGSDDVDVERQGGCSAGFMRPSKNRLPQGLDYVTETAVS